MDGARAADEALAHGATVGPLHGLPIAHKDLILTKGIRTTYGSRIYADFVPDQDMLIVERMRAAVPSPLARPTRLNLAPVRRPLMKCSVRPSTPMTSPRPVAGAAAAPPWRSPVAWCRWPTVAIWVARCATRRTSVTSSASALPPDVCPSTRCACLVAVLGRGADGARRAGCGTVLSVLAGPDRRVPISIAEPGGTFLQPLDRDFRGVRIAFDRDFGGLPVDPRVTAAIDAQRHDFAALGCSIEEGSPDFSDADEIFKT